MLFLLIVMVAQGSAQLDVPNDNSVYTYKKDEISPEFTTTVITQD